VYVVDNRIKNLYRLQTRIEELVPQARVSVAHGQMDEGDLERVMKEFVAGRCDVLVATTIIENGLDISNVNTIIIDHADTLGLSQLYQLRGRVGRSAEQAYAWLLTPPFKAISEISLRRLRVLEQYTDLGSGFQIAMRDLEIRGAGDVLGTMQHGAIVAVGFELYCRLLKEAIDEIQGRSAVEEEQAVKVDVEVDAYIPTEYVADAPTRVAIYRELSDARTPAAVAQVRAMLTDRFGPFPPSVEALMLLMDLKLAARAAGVSRASLSKDGVLTLAVQGTEEQVRVALKGVLASPAHHFEVMYETPLRLRAPLGSVSPLDRVREAVSTLRGSAS
jgi:transcription-repair coupling factor (superfamily II helicase)